MIDLRWNDGWPIPEVACNVAQLLPRYSREGICLSKGQTANPDGQIHNWTKQVAPWT